MVGSSAYVRPLTEFFRPISCRDDTAKGLLRARLAVERRGIVHERIPVPGHVRIHHRLAVEPGHVLRHAARPLPEIVEVQHRAHVALAHFLEQEVESLPQGFIHGVRLLQHRRGHRTLQRAGFGDGQHPQVPHALRSELIELFGEARPIAGGAGRTQVHAVPEIGPGEVIRLAAQLEMPALHRDEAGLVFVGRSHGGGGQQKSGQRERYPRSKVFHGARV